MNCAEWSVSQHRRFPKWAQDWILTIMLCDRRVAVEAFNHSDEDGKVSWRVQAECLAPYCAVFGARIEN
jgi:hypothetical protein